MTLDKKLELLNRWRVREGDPRVTSKDADGWNGLFIVPLEGEMWQVICSDGWGWKHVSVTNHQKKQIPPWDIMCRIRNLFFDEAAWVAQFHPPASEYVNLHPYTLHLWQPLWENMPVPQHWMV